MRDMRAEIDLLRIEVARLAAAKSELEAARDSLAASEAGYRGLYQLMRRMCDNVPDLIWAKDLSRRYIFANEAMCGKLLCAASTEEPLGRTDLDFAARERASHPDDSSWHTFGEICTDTDSLVLESGKPGRFEESGNVRGALLVLDVHKAPLLDDAGRMIGTVGCARDITQDKLRDDERRQMERSLAESELRFRTLVTRLPHGIAQLDTAGRLVFVNQALLAMFGMEREAVLGRKFEDLLRRPEDRRRGRELLRHILTEQPEPFAFTERLQRPGGGVVDLEADWDYLRDDRNRIRGFIVVASDVTEKRLADERLRASLQEKELLLREIHHRVKNNLQIVGSLLSLQAERCEDLTAVDMLRACRDRVRSMSLVHEKLHASDKLAQVDVSVYLRSVVGNLVAMYGRPGHGLEVEVAADAIEMPVGAAVSLGLLANELVTNSLKHAFPDSRPGRIAVRLTREQEGFSMTVEDDGVGVPEGFDLYRAETLGLQLATTVSEQLEGDLRVELPPCGDGTLFRLRVPLRPDVDC